MNSVTKPFYCVKHNPKREKNRRFSTKNLSEMVVIELFVQVCQR